MQNDFQHNGQQNSNYDVPYTTLHVGKLSGGAALNIGPDKSELLFEFRHLAEDNSELMESLIHDAATEVESSFGSAAKIAITQLASYPGLAVAESDPIVSQMQSWGGKKLGYVAFGTEAGVLSELDVRTVVCGPGSMAGQGHKPDEFISVGQLAACAKMLRNAVQDLVMRD